MTDHSLIYEVVDGPELARRWKVPPTWIRHQVQRGVKDPLPSVTLGRYRVSNGVRQRLTTGGIDAGLAGANRKPLETVRSLSGSKRKNA